MNLISLLNYLPVISIFAVAIYQFRVGRGFFYRGVLNGFKKENPELNEQEFRRNGFRTIVLLGLIIIAVDIALTVFR